MHGHTNSRYLVTMKSTKSRESYGRWRMKEYKTPAAKQCDPFAISQHLRAARGRHPPFPRARMRLRLQKHVLPI